MTDYRGLITRLVAGGVEFIIVGGAAGIVHGSRRLTDDLDVVYSRDRTNVDRIIESLAPLTPYLRGAPEGLPFKWEAQTILHGLNFTLTTSLGPLDLLGEITLGGNYEDLLPHTIKLNVFGNECLCLGLKRLIEVKCAAGRPKDREVIAELEMLLKEGAG